MPKPKTDRLSQLAAIAQLMGTLDRPQERESADASTHQEMALRMMGLMQQAENERAQRALQQQGLEQTSRHEEREDSDRAMYQQGQLEERAMRDKLFGLEKGKSAMETIQLGNYPPADAQKMRDAVLQQTNPEAFAALQQSRQATISHDMPSAAKAFSEQIGQKPEQKQAVNDAAWTQLLAQHPGLPYVDFTDPNLYAAMKQLHEGDLPANATAGAKAGHTLHQLPGKYVKAELNAQDTVEANINDFFSQLMGQSKSNPDTPPPSARRPWGGVGGTW